MSTDLVSELHALLNVVRTTKAPADVQALAAARVIELTAQLQPHAHPGPYAVEQLAPPGDGRIVFDAADVAGTVPYSPLLGRRNPTAPPSRCWAEDGVLQGTITFSPVHAGPMGQVHGAVIAGLFDEILALSMLARGNVGYTRSLEVRFARPTPLGRELEFRAECAARDGDVLRASAELTSGGRVTASATATFTWVARLDDDFYATRQKAQAQPRD